MCKSTHHTYKLKILFARMQIQWHRAKGPGGKRNGEDAFIRCFPGGPCTKLTG